MIQIYWSVLAVSRTPRAHSSGPVSGAHMCRLLVPATLVKVAGQMSGCCWLLAAVRCAPTLGVFRDLHSRRTVARRLRHRAHQVPGCLQWVRGHPTIPIICSSPNLSMHEMVCQLCNTGGGDVVTPWPLLRSGSLQLTFSQSTFIMTTTASSQHNTVSLGHILCFTMGSFSSKIDWFNVRCKMPRPKQKVQF